MRLIKKLIIVGLLVIIIIDIYNIFFKYNFSFDLNHFGTPIEVFADTKIPLRSTINVAGNFDCPIQVKHGFDLNKVEYFYTFEGLVDTVIHTEYYGGKYELEFNGQECVKELDKLNIRIYNLDFTILKLFF